MQSFEYVLTLAQPSNDIKADLSLFLIHTTRQRQCHAQTVMKIVSPKLERVPRVVTSVPARYANSDNKVCWTSTTNLTQERKGETTVRFIGPNIVRYIYMNGPNNKYPQEKTQGTFVACDEPYTSQQGMSSSG